MTEVCRLCGEFKSSSEITSTLDFEVQTRLISYFRISFDSNKYLPTSICSECSILIDKSCQFVQRIVDVQEQLKTEVLDEFETLEIERLDQVPEELVQKVKKRLPRNRGIKMSREVLKYSMDDLFKDELNGIFTSDVEHMKIPQSDQQIDGTISDHLLTTLSSTGWFNYDWKCLGCDSLFTNVIELEKHSIKCIKRRCSNSCQPCIKDFPSYSTFINHVTDKHEPLLKYSCIICSEYRWNFIDLHRHVSEVHGEHAVFFCLYCGKNFFTGALLRDHLIIHRPDAVLPEYSCDLCEFTTQKKQRLLSHMNRFHLDSRFFCEVCAASFKYRTDLTQHQQRHSDECNEKCPECGKMFKNKRKLRRHVRNMHEESAEVLKCEICGKLSKTKKLHLMHMKVHSSKKDFQCSYCDRSFKHNSGFSYHVRTHTGERPYLCSIADCGLKFIDWPNCRKHIRTTHGLSDAKPIIVKSKNLLK